MSTYLYLKCETHKEPISSGDIGRRDAANLEDVRKVLLDRDAFVEAYKTMQRVTESDYGFGGYNSSAGRTVEFAAAHPLCEIGLYDGYGGRYKLGTDSYQADWDEPIPYAERPAKIIHVATFRDGMAIPRCFDGMKLRRDDMAHEATCIDCIADCHKVGLL